MGRKRPGQFCKVVLRDETIRDDPRFCSNVQRVKHEREFDEVMNAVFGSTPRQELCARLDEAKVAYGAVNDCGGQRAVSVIFLASFD
eukprot:COSAG01_NODE_6160_length_3817_cov_3.810776_2_plen_87_part_00